MGQGRAHHDEVGRPELFLGIADDPGASAVHHQVDLVFGMVMDRIVEFGVGMVQDDEKVILVDGDDFLLEFIHGGRGLAQSYEEIGNVTFLFKKVHLFNRDI